jgi:hypothetical protein
MRDNDFTQYLILLSLVLFIKILFKNSERSRNNTSSLQMFELEKRNNVDDYLFFLIKSLRRQQQQY